MNSVSRRRFEQTPRSRLHVFVCFAVAAFVILMAEPALAQSPVKETIALVPIVPLRASGPDDKAASAGSSTTNESDPLTQYAPVITESVRIGLGSAGFVVKDAAVKPDFAELWAETARLEARLLVYGTCSTAGGRLVIQLSAYDTHTKQLVTGSIATGNIDLSLYNVINGVASDLAAKVRTWVAANLAKEYAGETKLLRTLTLKSPDDGASVYLPGGDYLGTVRNGKLVTEKLQVPVGSTVTLEVRKTGYLTQNSTVRVSAPNDEASLERMWPRTHFVAGLLWTTGFAEGGGLNMRFYLVPDWVYVSYAAYVSAQPPAVAGGGTLVHADNSMTVGTYLLQGPRKFVRLSMSYGMGAISTFLPGGTGSLSDFYVSFVNPTVDFTFRRLFAYVRINLRFVLDTNGAFLSPGVMGTPNFPPITAGVGFKW